MKAYATISGVVFAAIAVVQTLRAAQSLPVQVGTIGVPVWVSWVAATVAAALCVWAFRTARRAG